MNSTRRQLVQALLAIAAAPVRAQPARPLRVVASFSILADLVRNVGGDAVSVSTLVGPDSDAHVFEPTPADARRLADADLVVVNGLGFEGWLDRLVHTSGYRGPVTTASAGVTPRKLGRALDPHAWQDLRLAQRYVRNLCNTLSIARPNDAIQFERRAAQYGASLAALDAEVRETFAGVPKGDRRVITSHEAFGYFGAAYDIEFLSPRGMSTDSEPSASAVARLIEQIRHQGVRAVFVENIADPRLVEQIAREGGVTVGGKLYSDALSKPGTEADTYLKLFSYNASSIASSLAVKGQSQPRGHG